MRFELKSLQLKHQDPLTDLTYHKTHSSLIGFESTKQKVQHRKRVYRQSVKPTWKQFRRLKFLELSFT